ncbi:MAG: bifunctional riboflavin kinase/FAD synthetase [Clostridiales bacterium]|nr:bifunctional riboflavin kinase/FAD synthetase [Clostridiales bacterium]MDY2728974.1 bifunctional riboflavin kinase/FAD synthetase [Clostridium sp.]
MIIYDEVKFHSGKDILQKGTYVALGSFDGLHLGHISLVNKIVELAKKNNSLSMVYTFSNHPRKFVKPNENLKLLTDFNTKVKILKNHNVDITYFEKFDENFMERSAEEFIVYLIDKFNVKGIVVGFNYKFGYKNLGNTETLKKLSKKYNFDLYVMEPCKYKDKAVSSTRIRHEIINGNVFDVFNMLGRPYHLLGKIVYGKQIGRTIGFPTANLYINKDFVIPKIGVYYTNVFVDGILYKGITNVGTNPTVHGSKLTVETFILDFNEDIYGKNIEVIFIKKIRNQTKFNNIDELKNQLIKDKNTARNENLYKYSENYLQQ